MLRMLLIAPALILSPAAYAAGDDTAVAWYADPVTAVAFAALLVFLMIAGAMGAFKAVFSVLDSRAENIQKQIDDAQALREEAMKLMTDAERRAREADESAKQIVKRAKADAKQLMADAKAELEAKVARREKQAEQRISRAETQAADDVRRAAADAATTALKSILSDPDSQEPAFDKALDEISASLK